MARDVSNLIKNSDLTPKERKEKASRAGKASVEARREKKQMGEMMKVALKKAETSAAIRERMKQQGWEDDEMTQLAVMIQGVIMRAKKGDVQAFNSIRDLIGEKPVDETKFMGAVDTNVTIGYVETGVEPVGSEEDVDV